MFAHDRDLLAIEPNLFRDVAWLAQTIALTTGTLEAGTLTMADAVPPGTVAPGMVCVVSRAPLEIIAVPSSDTLTLSLTRIDPAGPQLVPADRSDAAVSISAFTPQLALTHAQLLRMLGITSDLVTGPGVVTEESILNPRDLTLVECLGALHLIYSAGAAALADTSPLAQRARMYQDRFARERWRVRARLDLDGDGVADAERTLSVTHLVRE
ncbi:MAG TPA: hypothetical protein PKE29_06415 [Phycisphaerales bacterium]|nr:hypothetical protein [Phycisphaerales bacterium]